MANLKEAIEYASKNPNSDFANELTKVVKSGAVDSEARLLGIDLTPIKSYEPTNVQDKSATGSDKATFQATGNEGIIGGTAKAIGNVPSSAVGLVKSVGTAVLNPIDTIKSVGNIIKGAGAKVGETLLEDTSIGQSLLQKANERRIAAGMQPMITNEKGKIQVDETPELKVINQVGKFVSDRYGTLDKFKETVIEDPVGVLADISTVLSGGATAATKVGTVSKVGSISNIGTKLSKAAQLTEPINAITKTTGATTKAISDSTLGRVVKEVMPTPSKLTEGQVTKALDLTQGDLTSISKKTGNNVTDFIVKNNLIKDTPEAVAESLNDLRKTQKELKATEIAKVNNIYTPEQVPSVMKGLDTILQGVDNVAGLENVANEIKTLKSKKQFTLEDIQNAQYLIDENSNIYSKIGDVKSSSTARGLDKLRQDIRSFIETEVDNATGGQTNIRQINNDIQTSYAIEDAIKNRATRNSTRSMLSLGDYASIGIGTTISPTVGIGFYIGKKVMETPAFRLAFVKVLNKQPINTVKRIVSEVKNKNVSPQVQKAISKIADEARKNISKAGSVSKIVNKPTEEKKQ